MPQVYMGDNQGKMSNSEFRLELEFIQKLHLGTTKFQRSDKTEEKDLESLGKTNYGKENTWETNGR